MHQVPCTTRSDPEPAVVDDNSPNSSCARNSEYEIPDIAIHDPQNRKIKVLTIGAGVSGIMMAYKLQKECTNVEHVIYEKDADIGGVWLQNRYPGAACDIPSHAYTYSFALNPDWPQFFSEAREIWQYLDSVCTTFGLRKYMTFHTTVTRCEWQSATSLWRVQLSQQLPDGTTREFEESCDVLLHATGLLHQFKWPNIQGLAQFKGKLIHTADWPKNYSTEDWKNERVAVIGSGASSIQTVPNMQPYVKHMDVFVRTAVWFVAIARNFGQNHRYSEEDKELFRDHPDKLVAHAKDIEDQVNEAFNGFFHNTVAQHTDRAKWTARMANLIQDERLRAGFTPTWGVGCRRVTPGDPYMKAIQQTNVDVHFTGVNRLTEDGVVGDDGVERKVDTVICATGFDVSYRPVFPIVGEKGSNLATKWKTVPESYLGLTVPDFPNLVLFFGPTWPVANGSAMGPLNAVGDYAVQTIKKLQRTPSLLSFAPRQDLTDAFNAHVQEWIKHTVWSEGCRSWYKNNETGRVNAVWPGSSLHYIQAIDAVRWEDYHLKYRQTTGHGRKDNPFSWLGMGRAVENHADNVDRSPYINRDAIDDEWLRAMRQKHSRGWTPEFSDSP